ADHVFSLSDEKEYNLSPRNASAQTSRLLSGFEDLKALRVPVRFLETAFAGVFEKLVDRGEQDASGAVHGQAHLKIEFVVQEMNVAITGHSEKLPRHFEIVGMNDAPIDCDRSGRCVRNTVTRSGDNRVQNSRERPKDRDGKDVAVRHFDFT